MHIANIIALTILVIGNIYRCIRHTDTGLQTITVPLRLLAFFSVDTRPHEHLEHLLLHVLAQVVKCASGDAEEVLGRHEGRGGARVREANVASRRDPVSKRRTAIRLYAIKTTACALWQRE